MAGGKNASSNGGGLYDSKGTGHPNKILQRDFGELRAGNKPAWIARIETYVTVDESQVAMVEKGLTGGSPQDEKAASDYLISQVPGGGKEHDRAAAMIAAALGQSFPFDTRGIPKEKAGLADRSEVGAQHPRR